MEKHRAYYKGFYGTKEEYIALCIEDVRFWSKAVVEEEGTWHRRIFSEQLDKVEARLAEEGWDWEDIEKIEIEAMKEAAK